MQRKIETSFSFSTIPHSPEIFLKFSTIPHGTEIFFRKKNPKSYSAEYELEGQAKFKCYKVVNLLSLLLTKKCYLWFWVIAGEQPYTQEMNLSKRFLGWEYHESWLLTRFLLPFGSRWTENFLRKGNNLNLCNHGLKQNQNIQRVAEPRWESGGLWFE